MRQVPRLAFPVVLAYPWVLMLLLGAIVPQTFLVYPNVFHDPPASLELGMRFLAVRGPDDVFPPLGFLAWVTGAGALVLAWPVRAARGWVLLGLAVLVGEGLASVLVFWPRNELLFVEGPAAHSADTLRRVAREFQALHRARRRIGREWMPCGTGRLRLGQRIEPADPLPVYQAGPGGCRGSWRLWRHSLIRYLSFRPLPRTPHRTA